MRRMPISGRAWGLRLTSGYEIFCCFYAFSVPVNDAIQPYQRSSSMNHFDPLPIFQKRDNATLFLRIGDTFEKNIFRIFMQRINPYAFYRSIGNIKNVISWHFRSCSWYCLY